MRPSARDDSIFSRTSNPSSATSLSSAELKKPLFPSSFGFYRGFSSTSTSTRLSLSNETPYFAHIQTCTSWNETTTDWKLFAGRDKAYREIASMKFLGRKGEPHITLGPRKFGAAPTESLEFEGFYPVIYQFSIYLELIRSRERFEWRKCCWNELMEHGMGMCLSDGMKLVRVRTRQIVALYVKVICSVKKTGKMQFLGNNLGNEFQIMAVLTLVAVREAEKRNNESEDWDWSGTTLEYRVPGLRTGSKLGYFAREPPT